MHNAAACQLGREKGSALICGARLGRRPAAALRHSRAPENLRLEHYRVKQSRRSSGDVVHFSARRAAICKPRQGRPITKPDLRAFLVTYIHCHTAVVDAVFDVGLLLLSPLDCVYNSTKAIKPQLVVVLCRMYARWRFI